ncbi:MAG TPA: DUF1064 domain-containing protein [Blastocatellia bacterium]|nr:DUF1064 domain-containing protein [Blastocatellia bacterium]
MNDTLHNGTPHVSVAELRALQNGSAGGSKYGNRPVTLADGTRCDSRKEGRRLRELRLLERAGLVRDLKTQVDFPLEINGIRVAIYRADFVYSRLMNGQWYPVVEDVKGQQDASSLPYRLFLIKKRLMKALHQIEVQEV